MVGKVLALVVALLVALVVADVTLEEDLLDPLDVDEGLVAAVPALVFADDEFGTNLVVCLDLWLEWLVSATVGNRVEVQPHDLVVVQPHDLVVLTLLLEWSNFVDLCVVAMMLSSAFTHSY